MKETNWELIVESISHPVKYYERNFCYRKRGFRNECRGKLNESLEQVQNIVPD